MRQAVNQYLTARKGFKLMERDDPMDVEKKARKARGKVTTRAQKSPQARAQERASKVRKERVLGKASRVKKSSKVHTGTVARQDTSGANVGRKAVEQRNKRTMSVRRRKLVT